GVFESMRAVSGVVFRLERHLERLLQSARLIDLTLPAAPDLARAIAELLSACGLREARIRLTATRGPGRPGDYVGVEGPPTIVITALPFTGIDPALRARGVTAAIPRRRPLPVEALDPSIKSISRLTSVLARREAHAAGAFEA